jgi:hypothetical protein
MPLIQDVAICQKLWRDALDQPFDADALAALKDCYDRARRQDATYRKLYKEQREITLRENQQVKDARRKELSALSKRHLTEMLNITNSRWTKDDIIESQISIYMVENEHDRVRRIWTAMSDAEREGL